jgi:acid phosphatase family membrane protein YuiD
MQPYALLIIPIAAGFLAQVVKFLIFSLKHGMQWRFLFEYGHMPSSHTAMMSALIFAIGYYNGWETPEFATALIIALLVISDALRLRTYIGSYGKTLNNLLDHLRIDDDEVSEKLKERIGHRPSEVLGGVMVGLVTALVLIRIFQLAGY